MTRKRNLEKMEELAVVVPFKKKLVFYMYVLY
jgi:hypothetical protein